MGGTANTHAALGALVTELLRLLEGAAPGAAEGFADRVRAVLSRAGLGQDMDFHSSSHKCEHAELMKFCKSKAGRKAILALTFEWQAELQR